MGSETGVSDWVTGDWKLYDLSRVHYVTAKDREIFMLVEKDYHIRKGLALVMISYKLQSQGASLLWGSSGVSSGSVVEVVEWSRVEERVVLRGWRENRLGVNSTNYLNVGGMTTVWVLGVLHS
nr:hypothetical protein [Tanacetum cinerariifolium]